MTHKGSCHCGAVAFEVEGDLTSGIQCDCSLCKRKNAVMGLVPTEQFCLTKGEDALSLYRWNTKIAKHYFCKHCGIYTHHQPRTRPGVIGVNMGCFDDIDMSKVDVKRAEGSKLSGGRAV